MSRRSQRRYEVTESSSDSSSSYSGSEYTGSSYSDSSTADEQYERERNKKKEKRMCHVTMPTGQKVSITVPTTSSCVCSTRAKTKFIALTAREFKIVSDQMNVTIKKHVPQGGGGVFSEYLILRMDKIENCCLWKRYRQRQHELAKEAGYVHERMLFHGSTAIEKIIESGFDERYANTVGMFGAGIYFAEHSSKSNQYVFGLMGGTGCQRHEDKSCYTCERQMLLCRVSLGTIHQRMLPDKMAHPPPGCHSVEGVPSPGGLLYPEFVVYRGEQAYPEYVITYKIVQ